MLSAAELEAVAHAAPRKKQKPDRHRKQLEALDAYFRAGGSLTVTEAIRALGIYALSQRVGQLINERHKPVEKSWETTLDGAKIRRYRYALWAVETPPESRPGEPLGDTQQLSLIAD